MRNWHILGVAVVVSACGGIVADPSPAPTPPAATSEPGSPGSVPGASAETPPTKPSGPPSLPEPDPDPGIFAAATEITIKGGTLGAPPGGGNTRAFTFAPSPTSVTVTREDSASTFVLEPAEAQNLSALLAQVRQVPMPTPCANDGPAVSLIVTRSGTRTEYFGQDYNCRQRTDVSYAKGLESTLAFLDALERSR